jgi:hypothetical protein
MRPCLAGSNNTQQRESNEMSAMQPEAAVEKVTVESSRVSVISVLAPSPLSRMEPEQKTFMWYCSAKRRYENSPLCWGFHFNLLPAKQKPYIEKEKKKK